VPQYSEHYEIKEVETLHKSEEEEESEEEQVKVKPRAIAAPTTSLAGRPVRNKRKNLSPDYLEVIVRFSRLHL
jgi:hypothetical protein